jgi:hypothetical protein
MALSAAYISIARVPVEAGNVSEVQSYSNIGSTTSAFTLRGGVYGVTIHASTYGTAALQAQAADGSTFVGMKDINGNAVSFSADGAAVVYLPPGAYRFALA